jgi:hypothetical protein
MTDNEQDARAAEAERMWHELAADALTRGDVNAAAAAVYGYGSDLERIYAAF